MATRYTIRTVIVVVTIFALCSLMLRTSHWLAAIGLGVAAFLLLLAAKIPASFGNAPWRWGLRGGLALSALSIAWFSLVDVSIFFKYCPDCSDHRHIRQVRVGGISVASTYAPVHRDIRSLIRADLGRPCEHAYKREHLARLWGLIVCARPCTGITCCLSGDPEYYNVEVARRVRKFAIDHPDRARELCDRIVDEDDFGAMHSFIATMKDTETR
ncbi:MAG: hypothetical protein KY475_03755 [Planctomycetes bacterium]|nr:hypothetical protein [Planctomycetota bacterium]